MKQIVVTGAAGFIGCNLVRRLNKEGFSNLILVDKFDIPIKQANLKDTKCSQKIDRDDFLAWLAKNGNNIEFIFHLGARTDTTEFDVKVLDALNLNYSKLLWQICVEQNIPLLYASSAATYGMGEKGFSDDHALIKDLKPLNPYGESKQQFDLFALQQEKKPPFWCGLKFFNVYGPYEYHKGRMASVVFHAYNQIMETGKVKLFKSHNPDYKDGEQLRDFVYVDDVIDICLFFLFCDPQKKPANGIYNAGSGIASSFNALVNALFSALNISPQIEFIPTPSDIRDKYQYFTKADMQKLAKQGLIKKPTILEDGIKKYTDFLKLLRNS